MVVKTEKWKTKKKAKFVRRDGSTSLIGQDTLGGRI